MIERLHHLPELAKDTGLLASGFAPLAFLGQWGTPAAFASLFNVIVFGALRLYDIRVRSRERVELARLRLELDTARAASAEG